MNANHFTIHCSSTERQGYAIWFSNDTEGIITLDRQILLFRTIEDLSVYSKNHHIILQKDPAFWYDFKAIEQWIKRSRKEDVQPDLFLNIWNIFTDMATSTQHVIEERTAETAHVYRKLFAANNLPSINQTGKSYIPHWVNKEIRILKEVLQAGIVLFNSNSRYF